MTRVVPVRESRLEVQRRADDLCLVLPRRRPWWGFLLPLWTLFVMVYGLVIMLTTEPPEDSGGGWFLVLWVLLTGGLLALALWGQLNREELALDSSVLTHTRSLGPVKRRRAYVRDRIENLRVSPEGMSMFDPRAGLRIYGVGGGAIAFDYGDRTVRFGNVEEAEATRAVAALEQEGLLGSRAT